MPYIKMSPEAAAQLNRFEHFIRTADLKKIGQRYLFFIYHDAKDGRYTPYVYLLRVLRHCANVGGCFDHPVAHTSYRELLEQAALIAAVTDPQIIAYDPRAAK